MASYHCSVKILKRTEGRSSVQFSAYMAGEKLYDERLGRTFSHLTKEEVCFNEMIFADRVPSEMRTQEKFWNSVEASEKQANYQVARTWEIALPHELSIEKNIEIAQEYARELVEKDGMPGVQVSVHQKEGNWHAHLMAPMRDMSETGKWLPKEKTEYARDEHGEKIPILNPDGTQKYRERAGKGKEMLWERVAVERTGWNNREKVFEWRERAADLQNRELERAGSDARVDHRSYADRGIDREPEIHEGYGARELERRGGISERCQENREIRERNRLRERLVEQLRQLAAMAKQAQEQMRSWLQEVEERRAERKRAAEAKAAAEKAEEAAYAEKVAAIAEWVRGRNLGTIILHREEKILKITPEDAAIEASVAAIKPRDPHLRDPFWRSTEYKSYTERQKVYHGIAEALSEHPEATPAEQIEIAKEEESKWTFDPEKVAENRARRELDLER